MFAPRYRYRLLAGAVVVLLAAGVAVFALPGTRQNSTTGDEISSQSRRRIAHYHPTEAEWANLTVASVQQQYFGDSHTTEGKIAIDEERATPIFSPYSGRVSKLLVKQGDVVARGQPLFSIEATEMVQGLNDFMSASGALNKARAQLNLAQTIEKRNQELHSGNATPLRDLQQAQAELITAQNELRSAQTTFDAARNRLRMLGRTDAEISAFQESGKVTAETVVASPIAGTIVQRKIGPGQYVSTGAIDPAFVVGDLSGVWLVAYVRETDIPRINIGQDLKFTVQALPNQTFSARIESIAAGLDTGSRRLPVRASVANTSGQLKPEMLATVVVATDPGAVTVSVPRSAVVFDGDIARVWVVDSDNGIDLREVRLGVGDERNVQVLDGLTATDRIVTKGSLFTGGGFNAS
ncbi:MAG: efflux RND transporter periplasmic adaptor subunit [Xanthobacteraceae bacterium]